MFWTLLNILLPVFGLIFTGALLQKKGFLDAAMEKSFNRFCYFIALPVFIFLKASQSPALGTEALKTAGALILVTLGFTFLGESLRDILDPKLRGKGKTDHA